MKLSPRGWAPGLIEHRLVDSKLLPQTYSKTDRTVDAVISMGSPVKRFYGTEILRIDPSTVIIDRLVSGCIPPLDSQPIGNQQRAWEGDACLV